MSDSTVGLMWSRCEHCGADVRIVEDDGRRPRVVRCDGCGDEFGVPKRGDDAPPVLDEAVF